NLLAWLNNYHAGPKARAADIACGPGIFTTDLAREFDSVIGVDLSPSMIASAQESAQARGITNVEYKVGTGESLPIESNSVDLLTVMEGVHWFKFDTFLDEALRVLKPGGTMALVGYKYPEVVGDTTHNFVNRLAFDEQYLLKYWDDGYKLVEGGYQPLVAPVKASAFENVRYVGYPEVWKQRIPEIEVLPEAWIDQRQSTLEELAGYFKTWSGYKAWMDDHPGEPDVVDKYFEQHMESLNKTLADTVAIDYPQFAIVA
ncbi:hypothetical protein EC988_009313, partial [Linderina pennispora]